MAHPANGRNAEKPDFLKIATEAAQIGGELLLTHLSRVKHYEIEKKGASDFATLVDHASERAIVEHIRHHFPDHQILAEEIGEIPGDNIHRWIIDPLDGTTNYLHDVRMFAVSIGLMRGGEPIVGVVNDPVRGELFTAEKGRGAFLNGSPISVTSTTELKSCLFATGFPFRNKELVEPFLESFRRFFLNAGDIRRMGAAALDLAYVAAGRFDGFWDLRLNRWDIAAGVLLVAEAGGLVSGFSGENFWETGNIVATNGKIHNFIVSELTDIFSHDQRAD